MSEKLNEIRAKAESLVESYNKVLRDNDFNAMSQLETRLKETEEEYSTRSQLEAFCACKASGNPVKAAAILYSHGVIAHKAVRENGQLIRLEIVDRARVLDLVKLCEFCEISHLWEYKVEKLNSLLTVRAAKELGLNTDFIKNIPASFQMHDSARKEDLGAVPISNTQMVKLLQMVFDAILFEQGNAEGVNKYRCNAHDIAYLLMCYTRQGREACSVVTAKTKFLHRILLNVMHRVVTGGMYSLDYQRVREKPVVVPSAAPAEPAPVDTPADAPMDEETVVIPKAAEEQAAC